MAPSDMMNMSVDILRRVAIVTSTGGTDYNEEVIIEGLACRIQTVSAFERDRLGQNGETVTHKMYMSPVMMSDLVARARADDAGKTAEGNPPAEDKRAIQRKDIVRRGATTYEITGVEDHERYWLVRLLEQ